MPLLRKRRNPKNGDRASTKNMKPNQNKRFQRTFIPLTRQPADLLEVVMRKLGVQILPGHDQQPRRPLSEKFCKFHNDYGHTTNDCCNLKIAIEKLIQEGELLEYVRRESGQPKRRKEDEEGRPPEKESHGEVSGKSGVISMIYGGPVGGDSNQSRKAHFQKIQMLERHEMLKVEGGIPQPEISFRVKDDRSLVHPYENALLISVELERYEIKRVFVDTGATVNVIFEDCFNRMDIQKPLGGVTIALHGFIGDSVMSLGSIDLMLTLGEGDLRIPKPVTVLVV